MGLRLCKDGSKIKALNSEADKTQGLAKDVVIQMGGWKSMINLLSTPLDEFDLILGNEFFMKEKVMVLPYLNGLFFIDETQLCFVQGSGKVLKKGKSSR